MLAASRRISGQFSRISRMLMTAADQRLRRVRHLIKSGNVRQIAGSRRKPEAENGADGKNMIREAAGISIMLADLPSSIVRQQTM